MDSFSRWLLVSILIVFKIVANVAIGLTTPEWSLQAAGFGRNIRHLPCVSRRTGETGVCMFAFSCAKANGTHLGTCIDRFYFGSCCKMALQHEDAVAVAPLDSNHIFEDTPALSTESYHLSTYQSVQTTHNTTTGSTTAELTTTTPRTTSRTTPLQTTRTPTTTAKSTASVPPSGSTHKPITSSKPFGTTPYPHVGTVRPKPPQASKPPTGPTASKPPGKPVVSTKPKPSNTTTHSKPVIKPSPQKPSNGTLNKPYKPVPTKRPGSSNTTKPSRPHPQKPVQTSSKPSSKPTSKPTSKPSSKPTSKPSSKPTSKPSSKPTSKPSSKPTLKPSLKPTSKPPQKYPTVGLPVATKPQTKPTIKPVPVFTTSPHTDPNYVQVSVVTIPTVTKAPSPEATTISNDVIQKPGANITNSTLDAEEESSNVINGLPTNPTTTSPLLVTWTTVDEVPVPPLPKPVSTPSSETIKNETKPSTTTTQTSQTWVQVPVSTPPPSAESAKPNPSSEEPSTTSTTQATVQPPVKIPPTVATTVASTTVTTTSTSPPSTTTTTTTTTTTPTSYTNATTESTTTNEINTENLNMTNYLDVCGRRLFPQSRIVGGEKATFGKWPWQISLRQWRTSTYLHKCGAALLNENWAITAAHCVENVAPSDLLLRLGEHDLSLEDEPYGYQERRVQIVASHPQFDPRTFEYDLALLRFYEPVTFQPNIIPVCVPQDDTNFVSSTAYVTGWGRLYEDGPLPSVLQEVSVPVINNSVCETMYRAAGYIEHIPEIFICAGYKKGGFDSCEGDSGGPMVIQRPDKRWLLAGVISWGIGCAEPNQPGVYTRISEFRGWINQILQF